MGFQQGISGLNAASRNLEVIGNNIANANTVGAKASRAEFSDVYANVAYNAGNTSAGVGVRVQSVTQQFTQGGIRTTENPLDVAINGRGFFRVAQPGVSTDVAYTRNGQFQLDSCGLRGHQPGPAACEGYQVDAATGKPGGVVGDILVASSGHRPPRDLLGRAAHEPGRARRRAHRRHPGLQPGRPQVLHLGHLGRHV